MLYNKLNKLFFISLAALSLAGCEATSYSYSADDIKYSYNAGDIVGPFSREVYKLCDGFTVAALANIKQSDLYKDNSSGYVSGIITIGEDPLQTAAFPIYEGGESFETKLNKMTGSNINNYINTAKPIEYEGKTYYCALADYYFGKLGRKKQKMYVSKYETLEEVAKDVLSKCKFETFDESKKEYFKVTEEGGGKNSISAAPYFYTLKDVVTIPSEYKGKAIDSIAKNGFEETRDVYGIIIDEGISAIHESAFVKNNDSGFKYITIPSSVTSIEDNAFGKQGGAIILNGADSKENRYVSEYMDATFNEDDHYYGYKGFYDDEEYLYGVKHDDFLSVVRYFGDEKNIVVPDNYLNKSIKHIERDVFNGKDTVETIFIPEGIKTIGDRAFYKCVNLKFLRLPGSATEYGQDIFGEYNRDLLIFINGSASYLQNSNLPLGLFRDNDHIYGNYYNYFITEDYICAIKALTKEASIIRYLKNEKEVIVPDTIDGYTITMIENSAFRYKEVEHIKLPSGLKMINDYAFCSCTELKELVLPNGAEGIRGSSTFYGCDNLEYFVLPASVTSFYNHFDQSSTKQYMRLNLFCGHEESSDFIQNLKTFTFKDFPNVKIYAKGEWKYDDNNIPYPLS